MKRSVDLADVPLWAGCRSDRDTCGARLCFGHGARLITFLARADGLVLGSRVFLSSEARRSVQKGSRSALELLEHELVHVEQFRRLGFSRFLWRYLGEYFVGRWRGLGHLEAYRAISLEKEARRVASDRMSTLKEPGSREVARQGALHQRS